MSRSPSHSRSLLDDVRPPPNYLSAAGGGYFTDQALRAGYFGGGGYGSMDLLRNAPPLGPSSREDLASRELEKQRIREEIIARETHWRRELEEEVRQELALEREFALRSRRPLDRLSLPTSSFSSLRPDRMPHLRETLLREQFFLPHRTVEIGSFQRLPEERRRQEFSGNRSRPYIEVGRGSLPFVDTSTPGPSTSGVKRKSPSPAAAARSKFDSLSGPKKQHKEWSCSLCQVSATSLQVFDDHLQGKKHRAKEAELKGAKSGSDTTKGLSDEIPRPGEREKAFVPIQHSKRAKRLKTTKHVAGGSEDRSAKKKIKVGNAIKKRVLLFCEYCNVECYSEIVMAAHYKGKKHKTRMNQLKKSQANSSNGSRVAEGSEREENTGAVTDEADDDMQELGGVENEDKGSEVGEKEIDGKVEEDGE